MFKKEDLNRNVMYNVMYTICSSENPQALSIFDVSCFIVSLVA